MSRINYSLGSQIEKWLVEIYEEGNAFKAIIEYRHIKENEALMIDDAIAIMKKINRIAALRIQVTTALIYVKNHPHIAPDTAQNTTKTIGKALRMIEENQCDRYEKMARATIEDYIDKQKRIRKPLGYHGILKVDPVPNHEELLEMLGQSKPISLDRRYKTRVRWKSAIAKVIERNRIKNDTWKHAYETVETYYQRVDAQVKNNIRAYAHDQYDILMKQHECFMKWLELFEDAMTEAEKNAKELYNNLDKTANRNTKIAFMLIRASASAALSPLFLNNFIDPTLMLFNGAIEKLQIHKGNISLNLSQSQALYQLTGYIPDPNSQTYIHAYEKLSKETIYEKIQRYKKYLQHKIDGLSKSADLADLMSPDSTLWSPFTPDQIIAAHRMKLINDSHYDKGISTIAEPENENTLINEMTKSLEATLNEIFKPLQEQYGSKESWKAIHQLIDKIEFNESRIGPDSHNQNLDRSLVSELSNQIEIYFIVKYLSENTQYFGGDTQGNKLYRGHYDTTKVDYSVGKRPDDLACNHLIGALLKRIIKTDAKELKKILLLSDDLPENQQLKDHPLLRSAAHSLSGYGKSFLEKTCPKFFGPAAPSQRHIKRQQMIGAIVNAYYNQDLGVLLQNQLIRFGKSHGIQINVPSSNHESTHLVPIPKWISDDELKTTCNARLSPYIQQADGHSQLKDEQGKAGLFYYRNSTLIGNAINYRTSEITDQLEKSRRIRFRH